MCLTSLASILSAVLGVCVRVRVRSASEAQHTHLTLLRDETRQCLSSGSAEELKGRRSPPSGAVL